MRKNIKLIFILFITILIYFFSFKPVLNDNSQKLVHNIKIGFSPGHSAKYLVLQAIEDAKYTIDAAVYSFTNKEIALALIKAKKKGVKLRIVADKKSNSNKYTAITYLSNFHVPVRLNDKYSIMHNKFMIIDNISIQTGSFNYTKNADVKNAENVIYIKNIPDISVKYVQEFNRLWLESKVMKPKY